MEPAVTPLISDKYAAIVVDARSGRVLYERASNAPRYPASLTKMMTLYLLFEALDEGRVRLDEEIPVSAFAASRPPSKLGIKRGGSIDARSAILALAHRGGLLDADAAFAASRLDEDFQQQQWGADAEAARTSALRQQEFRAAARFLTLANLP